MSSSLNRTVASFSLAGLLFVAVIMIGLWGPEAGLLQDASRAETERLFQAFTSPLARAIAQNDDLMRIDELHRLEKLPGVVAARVFTIETKSQHENSLIWEGKHVGYLEVRTSKTRWKRWQYRWLERAIALGLLFVLAAAACGLCWIRMQVHHKARVGKMLQREHERMERLRDADKVSADAECKRWLMNAIGWMTRGMLVLDESQHVVAVNAAAMEYFKVGQNILGTHWLDHVHSRQWAENLRCSIENPGSRVPAPGSENSKPISLVTFSKPNNTLPESTWIVIG